MKEKREKRYSRGERKMVEQRENEKREGERLSLQAWQHCRSVPFKIREDALFYEYDLIFITAYWMTVIHIPFTQLNVTSISLGMIRHDTHISPIPIMRLLQPSL